MRLHSPVSGPAVSAGTSVRAPGPASPIVLAVTLALLLGGCASAPRNDAPSAPVATTSVEPASTATPVEPVGGVDAIPPTQAEQDFAEIYGNGSYDPVADPTLPAPAVQQQVYDPWEPYNRRMHRFNNAVDRTVARPLARAYVAVVPRPVRLGVSNFFSNLGQPVAAVNALLQGKPKQAAHAIGRFTLNTTLGIGGIFDPASDASLANRSEDFGQTLGTWGWQRSRYVELPLFGPRTVRDVFGMVGDAPLSPLRQVSDDATRIPLQGLQLVDVRTQLLATDSLREGAADDYALVRDAWMQRRNYQIFGDRMQEDDDGLPDYLKDDNLPLVPAGAVPVLPGDG
ncbi:MlaA family lipoprotein [Novilysobacter spongiicola]|uniref:Phospholipid-binding lipoprotein MlaA n=1 Tax=Lysobacter spongiicola DSM 21749 TaxID=1122188 RepID=A0A1T4Q2U7_9GAMM|nr:MlaA family lipoprotein [Lysobacter spongiicola]SJZ97984.1 phospholipid-binding lipoprotein MlaA [Lysobacter spongiicola DSM 21749]